MCHWNRHFSDPGLRKQCPICVNVTPLRRAAICASTSRAREGSMLTLRTLSIVITGAGVLAGLPLTDARACDDDRYPCPPRLEALTQGTTEAPTQPAPLAQPQKTSAQPQKKAKQPAGQNENAHAKREQEAPRATARAKGDKPAVQEQAADSISQKPAEAAPTVVPSSGADQPLNAESRNENLIPTAAAAWTLCPNTKGTGAGGAGADTTQAAKSTAVALVYPQEAK